jgi:hypothetical protein
VLLLPDGHGLLELVDGEPRSLEAGVAVGCRYDDEHRRLGQHQVTEPVDQHDPLNRRPAVAHGRRELT